MTRSWLPEGKDEISNNPWEKCPRMYDGNVTEQFYDSMWHIHDSLKGTTKFQTIYKKKMPWDVRWKCDLTVL